MSQIKVGYVQHCGNDLTAVNAARISFGSQSQKLTDKDKKLIDYLAKNKHMSPFEHNSLTVLIECPLYIRSQIHRHRTFSYNEVSRRYTAENLEFFVPETIRKQSKDNKQASEGEINIHAAALAITIMNKSHEFAFQQYKRLIDINVPREQARGVLPQNLMTKFYMTGNLRNWVHFIELRQHSHAQVEVQVIAQDVKKIVETHFPESSKSLFKYVAF